jgi:hypothetical protein
VRQGASAGDGADGRRERACARARARSALDRRGLARDDELPCRARPPLAEGADRGRREGQQGRDVSRRVHETGQPILDASGPGGVPIKLIAEVAAPLYAKMGVKTGKDAKNGYATSYERVLAAILCSLSSRNQTLVAVHEGTDGCVVQAEIPSSMTTWKGKLLMTLERKAEGTLVSSSVVFEGQSSDWGLSKRALDDLHQDILNYRSLKP